MGVYNVGEGGLGQTYGPTAQLIAAYVVLRRPIAIGVAPNCISKRLGNRTPGGRDRALFTPDSQPIAVQLPAGRYFRNSWGTLYLRGGIRVRCRARGGKLWITGGGQVDKVLPSSVYERSVSRAGRETWKRYVTHRSGRWVDLATVEVPRVNPVDRVTIGPPAWARGQRIGKWTLTAEGSAAALARVTVGKQGLAGRVVTGLEYRIASGYSGKSGTVASDLRSANARRKAGPGAPVFVTWRHVLRYAGDWWDETDPAQDKAALVRYRRAMATLERRGYFVGASPGAEAPAGDSVEIVNRVTAGGPWPPWWLDGASIGPFRRGGPPGATAARRRLRAHDADRLCGTWNAADRVIRAVPITDKGRSPSENRKTACSPCNRQKDRLQTVSRFRTNGSNVLQYGAHCASRLRSQCTP